MLRIANRLRKRVQLFRRSLLMSDNFRSNQFSKPEPPVIKASDQFKFAVTLLI